ncbi:MAG: hypothetical protein HEP71_31990 [Roseivirga sp.]|nr:hypothetical protein [Roseivirga sp.]
MKKLNQTLIKSLLQVILGMCISFQAELTAQGLLAKKVIQYQSEGSWKDARQELNSYDAQGRISQTIYQQMKDAAWNNQTKMAFSYDEQSGLEKERIFYQWKDGKWISNLRFRAERDRHDRLINELIDQFREGEWKLSRKNSTTYEQAGSVKSDQTYYNLKDGTWSKSYKDEYLFEGKKLVEKTGFQMREGTWKKSLITSYNYNSQGERTEESISRVTAEGILEWRKTSFTYKDGTKTAGLVSVRKNERWLESEKHFFHYVSR